MKFSVVVPCHNESANIPLILEKFWAAHEQCSFELIVVENASTDDSATILKKLLPSYRFATMVSEPVPGYGRAICAGLRAAKGEVLAWTHADLQTDPSDVVRAYRIFERQSDPDRVVVKGKRVRRSFGAWFFTFGMSLIASVVLRGAYFDINAQPKMFSRQFFLREFKNPPDDFSLDLYLLALVRMKRYDLITFPVLFSKRLYGESKWAFSFSSKWKTIARTIRYIFQLRKKLRS